MKFDAEQWKMIQMLMDYCNNLGLMKETMLKVEVQGDNIIITTESP